MSTSLTIKVLKVISNPVRKSIVQSLSEDALSFSELMRACGMNPNHDTGPFGYHLSRLVNLNIVKKTEDKYRLTEFGRKIIRFISTVERESLLLLQNTQGGEVEMKVSEAKQFTLKDGRKVILRTLKESELDIARQMFRETFREDKYPLHMIKEKYRSRPSLFIGCFEEEEIVGTVFGWPDYPEYPEILSVNAIIVAEIFRRKEMGTKLLEYFEEAGIKEGFRRIVLGAEWEAVPFYTSYGLDGFANIQIALDKFPWNAVPMLRSKYDITGAAIFGSSIPSNLIARLNKELKIKTKSVTADFESLSIQVKPKTISKKALEEIKTDFNAYSAQFAFRKELSNEDAR